MRLKRMNGLTLVGGMVIIAVLIAHLSWVEKIGFSALTVSILLGMLIGNLGYIRHAHYFSDGVAFAKQKMLRWGVVLFGFKLTLLDISQVGIEGMSIDFLTLCSTFLLAFWIGRRKFKLDTQSVILIGAGSSICGAAAILATESVIKASSEKVAVAVATVVIFGTCAMFIWPLFFSFASQHGWGAREFGIFEGSTIHEIAQVAIAGEAVSEEAMKIAVITKMIRVMMLAPFLLLISSQFSPKIANHNAPNWRTHIPWFAVLFLAVILLNSSGLFSKSIVDGFIELDNIMLLFAMAALGLTTHVGAIRRAGLKPLLLAFILGGWLLMGGAAINVSIHELAGMW